MTWLIFKISILVLSLVTVAEAWLLAVLAGRADDGIRKSMSEVRRRSAEDLEQQAETARWEMQSVRKVGDLW